MDTPSDKTATGLDAFHFYIRNVFPAKRFFAVFVRRGLSCAAGMNHAYVQKLESVEVGDRYGQQQQATTSRFLERERNIAVNVGTELPLLLQPDWSA